MKDLTPQEELDKEQEIKDNFEEMFSKYSLEELYLIKEELEKEIRLSETAVKEGFEKN